MQDCNKELQMSMLVTPNYANFSGVMHGGDLVKILDQVAYSCATRFCGVGTITLAINNVSFLLPIKIGSILHFLSSVNYVGNSSMEIGIKVKSEDPKTKVQIHTNSAYFMMLAYENGKKVPIRSFEPQTQDEKRRWKNAISRIELLKK